MEHNLLIGIKLKSKNWFFNFMVKKATQHKSVYIGISIENIGNKPFTGATIGKVIIENTNSNISSIFKCLSDYNIKSLNPNEKSLIWLDCFVPSIDGEYALKLDLTPVVIGDNISVSKYDPFKKIPAISKVNGLYETFYVKNSTDIILARTNILFLIIAILTLLTTLITLFN